MIRAIPHKKDDPSVIDLILFLNPGGTYLTRYWERAVADDERSSPNPPWQPQNPVFPPPWKPLNCT